MMYDELVKKLRYCGNSVSCLHCPYWAGCGGSKEDLLQAADAIEELRKAVLRLEDESGLYDELPTFYIYPTAHWILNKDGSRTCSECGHKGTFYEKQNFCPNCGAKMELEDDN